MLQDSTTSLLQDSTTSLLQDLQETSDSLLQDLQETSDSTTSLLQDSTTSLLQDSTTQDVSTSSVNDQLEPPTKRRRVQKSSEDKIPLPEPFLLPKHYQSDVETTLETGKMTAETTSAFITSIKGAILVYKKYPTGRDLEMVAKTIVRKYKFLASPVGTPYVSKYVILFLV